MAAWVALLMLVVVGAGLGWFSHGRPGAVLMLAIAGGAIIYGLPIIVASRRRCEHAGAATAVCLLLGWTVVGWGVAMIIATCSPPTASAAAGRGFPVIADPD